MKKAFLAGFAWALTLLLLVSCQTQSGVKEVELDHLEEAISSFFQGVEDTNGTYMYHKGEDIKYVMLNGKNTHLGQEEVAFTHFDVEVIEDTLTIHYTEDEFSEDEAARNQVVYEITENSDISMVAIYKNGEESIFEVVSGGE